MDIVLLLFDDFTALDAVGPYEVLSRVPGARVTFAARRTGPHRTDRKSLAIEADVAIGDIDRADILVVPGGFGTRPLLSDHAMLDWVRAIHETTEWTTSVCTGSLVLAAAGLLDGLEATTHWTQLDLLGRLGATPTQQRVVEQGKIITAAGVSSGIDMALLLAGHLVGPLVAQTIQLAIEYDPQPPWNAGSLATAPQAVIDLATENLRASVAADR